MQSPEEEEKEHPGDSARTYPDVRPAGGSFCCVQIPERGKGKRSRAGAPQTTKNQSESIPPRSSPAPFHNMAIAIMTTPKAKQKRTEEEDWPRPAEDDPEFMGWAIWNACSKDKNGKRIII